MKNIAYDPVKDFAPVSRLGSFTLMLLVHPGIPAKIVKELIAYAKANPGKLSFASGNTAGVVAGETLKHWAKLDMLHVPYKSSPPALTDVLAGRVSMMFTDFTTGMPHVQSGALRALAMTRHQAQRAVARAADHGRGRRHRLRHGCLGRLFRAGRTRRPTSSRCSTRRCARSSTARRSRRQIAGAGFEAFSSSPQELDDYIKVQLGKWTKMIKDAGIQPE